jgi:hypothetical protein
VCIVRVSVIALTSTFMDFCTVPSLALNLSSIRNSLRKKNMAPTKDDIPDDTVNLSSIRNSLKKNMAPIEDDIPADSTTAFQPMDCDPSEYSPPMKKSGIGDETDPSPSPQSCDSSTDMENSRRSEDSGFLSWRNTSSDCGSLSPSDYSPPPSKRARDTDTDKDDMIDSSLLSTECTVSDTKTSTPFKRSGKEDSEACHRTKDLGIGERSKRKAVSRQVGTNRYHCSNLVGFSMLLV